MTAEFLASYCPTVYGPVKSRRHGRSLGINLGVPNRKVCTWGCVYCQCGMGERGEIADAKRPALFEISSEVREYLQESSEPMDSITVAGNSEPGTHPDFLPIVKELLAIRESLGGQWTINCLSNGSELDRTDVVRACRELDEAWIKMDCALDDLFQRLNRPMSRVGKVADHIARITKLGDKIRIQTLLWDCQTDPSLTNATPENLAALLEAYCKIRPRQIHLTTVSRTPALPMLTPVAPAVLESFAKQVQERGLAIEVFGA